jgi:hypothetical protein
MAMRGRAMDSGGACDEAGAPGCRVIGRGSWRVQAPGRGKSGGWLAAAVTEGGPT